MEGFTACLEHHTPVDVSAVEVPASYPMTQVLSRHT
jgi:hypothetical protein